MGWRFRKSFKVLPGVRLNLTRRGLSATVGSSPFSFNMGASGVHANLSIPGSGVSARFHPGARSVADIPGNDMQLQAENPVQLVASPAVEVRSDSTERLNSENMAELKALIKDADTERVELQNEIASAEREAAFAQSPFQAWHRGMLFKRLFSSAFAVRVEVSETADAKLSELREQLALTKLAMQIDIGPEQAEPYYRMRDEFAALTSCRKIWDTLSRQAVNRTVERSAHTKHFDAKQCCSPFITPT